MEKNTNRELTLEGKLLCGIAGFFELALTFLALGLSWSLTPLPVLLFLWLLFGILTGGAALEAAEMCGRRGEERESVEKLVLEMGRKV